MVQIFKKKVQCTPAGLLPQVFLQDGFPMLIPKCNAPSTKPFFPLCSLCSSWCGLFKNNKGRYKPYPYKIRYFTIWLSAMSHELAKHSEESHRGDDL